MDFTPFYQTLFQTSGGDLSRIEGLIVNRSYKTEILSFIQNHSRILSYWGSEINILPPSYIGGKWSRYSFSDLIWIYMVKQLRDFGMEKSVISNLKNELYGIIDVIKTFDSIKQKRKDVENTIQKLGADPNQARVLVDAFLNLKDTDPPHFSILPTYIAFCIASKLKFYLLINIEGKHYPFFEIQFESWMQNNNDFKTMFKSPHICLCLNDAISHFLPLSEIKDDIKESFFSADEWKIISLIRQNRPLSVTIQFAEDKSVETIEVTKKVYLSLEQRLQETMAKGAYGSIKVIFENGKAVYATNTIKHKIKVK